LLYQIQVVTYWVHTVAPELAVAGPPRVHESRKAKKEREYKERKYACKQRKKQRKQQKEQQLEAWSHWHGPGPWLLWPWLNWWQRQPQPQQWPAAREER
jgi:hypothetical protein